MKAIMSETLREILRDPKKNMELKNGLVKLRSQSVDNTTSTIISVGNNKYEVKFAEIPR